MEFVRSKDRSIFTCFIETKIITNKTLLLNQNMMTSRTTSSAGYNSNIFHIERTPQKIRNKII